MSESVLTHARYGKDLIRVFRVVRDGKFHRVVEYNVTVLLEGDIESSYTLADNSVIVATDSIKNITYYFAKTSPHILSPERFALHLGTHIVSKYTHIHRAFVTLEKLRWSRIALSANDDPHPHAFVRDGNDRNTVQVEVSASADKDELTAKVTSGITDLLILKSSGSAFDGFVRDEYTTLGEVDDRILSTSVDLSYTFAPLSLSPPTDGKKVDFSIPKDFGLGSVWDGDDVATRARNATLDIFAVDESASVQATLFKMGQRVIAENPGVASVTYNLPNKHYIPVDMKYIGIDNITPLISKTIIMDSEQISHLMTMMRRFLLRGFVWPNEHIEVCLASGSPWHLKDAGHCVYHEEHEAVRGSHYISAAETQARQRGDRI